MRKSGIVGMTHDEDGEIMANRNVVGRVALGKPAEDGRNYPTKINYFLLKQKKLVDGDIEWPASEELMELFDPEEQKPTSIPVMLVSDDPDEILFSQLQYWRKGEAGDGFRFCYGDGREAMRWSDEKQRHVKFADPDNPDLDGECPCPYYTEEGKCDSRGYLYFQVLTPDSGDPVEVGGVFSYQTSSAKIIRKLQGSIQTLKKMLANPNEPWQDAEIKGRRLMMKISYMSHNYRDNSGELRRGIVAYPYLTLPVEDSENPRAELEQYRANPQDVELDDVKSESDVAEGGMVDENEIDLTEDELDEPDENDSASDSDEQEEDEDDGNETEESSDDETTEDNESDETETSEDDEEWDELDDLLD